MVALPFSANCRVIDQYVPVELIMLNAKGRKEEMVIDPFKHKIWLSSPQCTVTNLSMLPKRMKQTGCPR